MNLTELKPKARLFFIVIIIFIVIILIIVVISSFTKKESKETQPSPSIAPNVILPPQIEPEKLPPSVQEIRQQIINSFIRNEAGDLLLFEHENKAYRIEYIPAPDVFFVKIFNDPAIQFKQESQNWFKDFGLKQEDLCDLPVRFVLGNFEIRKTNPAFTSLPDGCTGQPQNKPSL